AHEAHYTASDGMCPKSSAFAGAVARSPSMGSCSSPQPDHRHRCLLRSHRKRPRRRAPEPHDELAPSHSLISRAGSGEPIPAEDALERAISRLPSGLFAAVHSSVVGPEQDWACLALPGPELRGLRTRPPEPRLANDPAVKYGPRPRKFTGRTQSG